MVDARLRGMAAATVIFFSAWQCLQPIESKPAFAEGADRGARETSHSTRPRTEDLPPFGPELTVAEIAAKVRGSTFVISVLGREGERASLGSGFAVGNALIATNLHVIGDARPIVITDAAGRKYDVLEVYATDRARDLAVLKVKSTDLQPLPLGDSEALKQGEEVVGVGNPRGLEHSVVSGVVSGKRTIEGKPMIQLAVPIEQGNSGGPLVDRHGRVQGILTMKSIVTENLGFAVGINALKPLLSRPNPVRMEQWLTIGALEPSEWTPMFGARWRQRAGRVVVEGPGAGFGGRSLLLSKRPHPLQPFEIAVSVRLKREEGAAGIVFHFQDGDRHYGFYPSNGSIRLSRFDGPDVYSWHVLREVRTSAYHPGEWNRLRIRVEDSKISGYVNGVLVVQSHDDVITSGQLGLCSFRETQAEFRNFDVGKDLSSSQPSMESVRRVNRILEGLSLDPAADSKAIESLLSEPDGVALLRQRADRREREARQLRQLAARLQFRHVQKDLSALFEGKAEKDVDLLQAALLIARIDNADIDVSAYIREIDRMAQAVRARLPAKARDEQKLKMLDEYLFGTLGFHGSRADFYNRSNSYLNEVIDDREGLPITLSVLYIELARRLEVEVVGVGLPGRFMVALAPVAETGVLIDVYEGARRIPQSQAIKEVEALVERPLTPQERKPQTKRQIIVRLLQNLLNVAAESNDPESMLRYNEVMLSLDPASVLNHWQHALLCFQTGRRAESLAETAWLLARDPDELSAVGDPAQIRQLKSLLESLP